MFLSIQATITFKHRLKSILIIILVVEVDPSLYNALAHFDRL